MEKVISNTSVEDNEEKYENKIHEMVNQIKMKLFMLDVYANMDIESCGQEDLTNMKRAQQYAKMAEFQAHAGNNHLLNSQEDPIINLSFTERKVMQNLLEKNLHKKLERLLKVDMSKVRQNEEIVQEIIELQKQRRENYKTLAELLDEVIRATTQISELQLGSHNMKTLEVMNSEANLLQIKGSLLTNMITKQFRFRTDSAAKAIEQAKKFLDEAAKEKELQQ